MSKEVGIQVDTELLEWLFEKLTSKELAKAQKRALSKAGRLLYRQTQKNASVVPNVRTPNPKYSDTMYDGVRMGVMQDSDYKFWVKVHILGTRKKSSGTFRLRFFEGGTVPRKTKNAYTDSLGRTYPAGQNRGQLKAYNFFSTALSAKQNEVVEAIKTNFDEELTKIIKERTK